MTRLPRSALYVPGDAPDKLAKASGRGADELIVDLEDAVPYAGKAAARAAVAAWLRDGPVESSGRPAGPPAVWVRINPGEMGRADVRAVVAAAAEPGGAPRRVDGPAGAPTDAPADAAAGVPAGVPAEVPASAPADASAGVLAGVCVAKAESAAELVALDELLTALERRHGLPAGGLGVVPLLESAAAVLAAPELARAPRVVRLQLGEADLRADLGVDPGPDERELLWARSQVVLAAAAARIAPPIGPVGTEIRDLGAFRESTLALRRLGFHGRACVHPAQVTVVNEVFTPSEAELTGARDVLARYERAVAGGSAICLDARGRLVDEAVIRSARRLLSLS